MRKDQILSKAFKDYALFGIKRVSMDDIVKSLKISKKTLYEFFPNKEKLDNECLRTKIRSEERRVGKEW